MADDDAFKDFYGILHVHPYCDAKMLDSAYHRLAKTHHPDHTGNEDSTNFHAVTEAYTVLRDPRRRAKYDDRYARQFGKKPPSTPCSEANDGSQDILTDAEAHEKILRYLYDKRRKTPSDPGVVAFYLQEMLQCSYESVEFHKWYLKEKGFVSTSEQGTLAITVQGIDHVLLIAKTSRAEKLMLPQSGPLES